jgi:hypothetical protein
MAAGSGEMSAGEEAVVDRPDWDGTRRLREGDNAEMAEWLESLAAGFYDDPHLRTAFGARDVGHDLLWSAGRLRFDEKRLAEAEERITALRRENETLRRQAFSRKMEDPVANIAPIAPDATWDPDHRVCGSDYLEVARWLETLARGFCRDPYLSKAPGTGNPGYQLMKSAMMLAAYGNADMDQAAEIERLREALRQLRVEVREAGRPDA